MHRIISEVRPRYTIIENVPMLTIRGGTRVIADLTSSGFDSEWQIIGADQMGAWHRRKRIWIVAYPRCEHGEGQKVLQEDEEQNRQRDAIKSKRSTQCDRERVIKRTKDVSNTDNARNRTSTSRIDKHRKEKIKKRKRLSQSKLGGYRENIYYERTREYWQFEPDVGRVANGIPYRMDRLRGLGNAIVPQVAYEIMKRIK